MSTHALVTLRPLLLVLLVLSTPGCFGADVAPSDGAYLSLDAEPRAAVYVDGTLIGNTPQRNYAVEPGDHEVRLECVACEQPQQRTLAMSLEPREIYTHDCTVFDAGFEPAADARAHITVHSRPWSNVYLDGTLIGHTPKQDYPVEPGIHEIVLRCNRCDPVEEYRETVTLAAGETWSNVRVRFESEGTSQALGLDEAIEQLGVSNLQVQTEPWSTVVLDGVEIGRTPVDEVSIPSGTHELVVRCGPCIDPDEEHLIFSVEPGATHRVDFTFHP